MEVTEDTSPRCSSTPSEEAVTALREKGRDCSMTACVTPKLPFPQPVPCPCTTSHTDDGPGLPTGTLRAPQGQTLWLAHATLAHECRSLNSHPRAAPHGPWSQIHPSLNPHSIFALTSLRLSSLIYKMVERTVFNKQGDHPKYLRSFACS